MSEQHIKELSAKGNDVHQIKKKYPPKKQIRDCRFCGGDHPALRSACFAYGKKCASCGQLNHFAKLCKADQQPSSSQDNKTTPQPQQQQQAGTKKKKPFKKARAVNELEEEEEDVSYFIGAIDQRRSIAMKNEIHYTVHVNGHPIALKVDTGAKCNVLPLNAFNRVQDNEDIDTSRKSHLIGYGGHSFDTLGMAGLHCKTKSGTQYLEFNIVNRPVTPVLGLKDALRLNLIVLDKEVHQVTTTSDGDEDIFLEFKDLFDDELGKLPVTYRMKLDESVTPVIRPSRRIPHAMEKKVKAELDHMEQIGVNVPQSEPTEWVSQMVATNKKNGEIRVCIDPRDLNRALMRPHHPMRTVEEVASRMANASVFSTLDAKSGFWQIQLDHESSLRLTFGTPYGRYRFLRMPFGISTASEVFQRAMEEIFAGYPCAIIVDDLLVWGTTLEEHDINLRKVLERAREVGLKLNMDKCKFRVNEVSYVGHKFTAAGLKPNDDKIEAIRDMPIPEEQAALQRFLGMSNYLLKFIENYSEKTAPLRELLRKDNEWHWDEPQQTAFDTLRNDICNPPVLRFYDPDKPVILSVDASKNGLGAACLQEETPVAYASRSLTDAETRYAQIEKELLAAVFACTKFHDYIYGRTAIIETDHKPLITIVKKPLHAAPARLQRMLLQLQRYNLEFVYKKGTELYLADTLSRACDPTKKPCENIMEDFDVMSVISVSKTRMDELKEATLSDPVMVKLANVIRNGWPDKCSRLVPELRPYFASRDELVILEDIIMKGQQVVVPEHLRSQYIEHLHKGHPSADRTKSRAKDTVFWPTINKDISDAISRCAPCNSNKSHQQKEPLLIHPIPELPWSLISADIFEWNGIHYLVVVDSYSGWFELDTLHSLTSAAVIRKLKRQFAQHGSPEQMLSDNGPQFSSREFKEFSVRYNFQHVTSSPLYPQSNGLAENAVKQAKDLLEKTKRDGSDLCLGLLNLRNIPRGNLGSPAQRLMSRRTRSVLPIAKELLEPNALPTKMVSNDLRKARETQKKSYQVVNFS